VNGAQTLIRTLAAAGVDVCFSNPGTSELYFVSALDVVPRMRAILALFEGVATGAADGYGRMADRPAATLLHLGPGLTNGLANLHNAMRARTPMVNIIGDHATYHKQYEAPLESNVESYAKQVSCWVRTARTSTSLARDTAEAVAASMGPPAGIASLILPADVSWQTADAPSAPIPKRSRPAASTSVIEGIAQVLRKGEPCAFLLGGSALRHAGLNAASRIAQRTNARLLCETFPARLERGAGIPAVERINYVVEKAIEQLKGIAHLITVDAKAPVAFFAYPDKPSYLVPNGCSVYTLSTPTQDATSALEGLAEAVGARQVAPQVQAAQRPDLPSGALNAESIGRTLGVLLPAGAIVVDEGISSSMVTPEHTAGGPPHSWLCLTGGAIGQGMPAATGAAVACPDRKVINLEADGSAMYTVQALWTQARERLDVTTVIFSNRAYAILNAELARADSGPPGPRALSMLDLSNPVLDFVSLARSMGVRAARAESAEDFTRHFSTAMSERGPHLIEAIL
jgi:acetolactate synthase-1/2/3 large subunit